MKTKIMKLSQYFEIIKPQYVTLKLIPIKSNRNIKTEQISQLINKMYRNTSKLIYKEGKKLVIEPQFKVSFFLFREEVSKCTPAIGECLC